MGDYEDLIINGVICKECECEIDGEEVGYPRLCEDCIKAKKIEKEERERRTY
jgi:hypothetical protein